MKRSGLFIVLLTLAMAWSPGIFFEVRGQTDVNFFLRDHLLAGKKIIKVKRDFSDPFVWVLAANNEVFRINSITKDVVDYSANFLSYHHLNFIDIAGKNAEAVFIACKSNNVLFLRNGSVKNISIADGLNSTVNSIGLDFNQSEYNNILGHYLRIGAENSGYVYNTDTENLYEIPENGFKTEIFHSSHNGMMARMADYSTRFTGPVNYYSVFYKTASLIYEGYIWKGPEPFGPTINTAYYTFGIIENYLGLTGSFPYSGLMDELFWGNSRGIFRVLRRNSDYAGTQYYQYLQGVEVNKIASIHGGAGLSAYSSKVKENLLAGTANGLYFSNNIYRSWSSSTPPDPTFFTKYAPLGNIAVNDLSVNLSYKTLSSFCEDGIWVAADDGLYFLKADYSSSVENSVEAVKFKNQAQGLTSLTLCAGSSTTLTLNNNYSSASNIQWFKDGDAIPYATGKELEVSNSGEYHAVLYDPCSEMHIPSNVLKTEVISGPEITFNYNPVISVCKGQAVPLTTVSRPGYQYRWLKNGLVIPAETTNSYVARSEGRYQVEVSSCPNTFVQSPITEVKYITIPSTSISMEKAGYCTGETAVLQVTKPPGFSINWYRNGVMQAQYDGMAKISTNSEGIFTAQLSISGCSEMSPPFTLSFSDLPVFTINSKLNRSICYGEEDELSVSVAATAYEWSTGETTRSIRVKSSGEYEVTVKNASGCGTTQKITVTALNPLAVTLIPDTVLCSISGESLLLKADEGYRYYYWNGSKGTSNTFNVSSPGNYALEIEDINGCRASTTFTVRTWCRDIIIPNIFTPDGDMINDKWMVSGLEEDKSAKVEVFNRSGSLVFRSVGIFSGWDGRGQGGELPAGSYYYIITTKNAAAPLRGAVTIVR